MSEPTLFDETDPTIQERFLKFHAENPGVYRLLLRFAREAQARGYQHFAIGALWERMRWEIAMTWDEESGFKLNDHFRSRYARLLMAQEPGLTDFFEIRRLRSA